MSMFSLVVSLVVSLFATHCHSISLVVILFHSLSLVVICCHSLSFVVPLVVTRLLLFFTCCITHCRLLSLFVPLVVTCCHSLSPHVPLVCLFINDLMLPTFQRNLKRLFFDYNDVNFNDRLIPLK